VKKNGSQKEIRKKEREWAAFPCIVYGKRAKFPHGEEKKKPRCFESGRAKEEKVAPQIASSMEEMAASIANA